jgi:hemoglobin
MDKSLYERLGGAKGISALVDDIVAAHMVNPVINARFLPYRDEPARLATIKQHLCNFLGAGSGGPEQYGGRDMRSAHRGMNVSEHEYMATIDDIIGTLEKHGVDEATRKDVLAIAWSLKGDIMRI